MLPTGATLDEIRQNFRWNVPSVLNIATACVDRHADGSGRTALVALDTGGQPRDWSFDELARLSCRLANVLQAQGIGRGDRVAIVLGQRVETLLTHLAVHRLGAISLPMFLLFGPEALEYRLSNSGAVALVSDHDGLAKVLPVRDRLPALRHLWSVDEALPPARPFWADIDSAADTFPTATTAADDPALLIYTSGTTGAPKGALHAHRVLLGHLPGVQLPQELFPRPGDRFWTPADWAWIGGLLDVLLPSLYFGVTVVAGAGGKFEPDRALDLMARHEVRNVFMPPTALRLMRREGVRPLANGVRLRSIGSGGERLGDDTLAWGAEAFGCAINEFYGQTEANLLVASCRALFPPRPGAMGVAVPGHDVAIIDEDGQPVPPGTAGTIAVRRPDPVMFLGYWNNPDATAAKFRGDWLMTGDLGRMDEDGYLTYLGREDDLISSAGYRIGPAEIEECLMAHPAVALCAVIGVPDELRGERVKAFVVPQPGRSADDALARDIQEFVKKRLAAHEYPREVAFVDALPLTATGKVRRSELRLQDTGRARSGSA